MADSLVPLYWHEIVAGHLPMPEHFRPPMSDAELACFSQTLPMIIRSTSFLFDVREGCFTLRIDDGELSIVANNRLGPGDISCIEGLIATDPMFERDEDEKALEASILAEHGMKSRGDTA